MSSSFSEARKFLKTVEPSGQRKDILMIRPEVGSSGIDIFLICLYYSSSRILLASSSSFRLCISLSWRERAALSSASLYALSCWVISSLSISLWTRLTSSSYSSSYCNPWYFANKFLYFTNTLLSRLNRLRDVWVHLPSMSTFTFFMSLSLPTSTIY